MIFELPDIFFGSHKKRKGITTTAGETVRIYKKGRKSLTTSGFFKKSGDIFFGATSQYPVCILGSMVERPPCKQRVACSSHAGCSKNPSARKREKLSIGRSGTNRAHKFADGKTMADEKT